MDERPEETASQDRSLDPASARAYLEAPVTEREREDVLALVSWFRRRYPTPVERLAYTRRAYARWQRTLGLAVTKRSSQ